MDTEVAKLIESLSMLDERTMKVEFHEEIMLDLDAITLVDKCCDEFVAGRRLKRLIIAGKNTQITKEARIYGQEKSRQLKDMVIAEAVVVNSLPQKMVANFYFAFIKEFYPARFFTDVEKAKEWLLQY